MTFTGILDLVVLLVVLLSTEAQMVVPDAAVYAALPTLGAAALWIGRQFVQSVTKKEGRHDEPRPEDMSVRSFNQLIHLFKTEFDDRYMSADEARRKFGAIENKIDQLSTLVQRKM